MKAILITRDGLNNLEIGTIIDINECEQGKEVLGYSLGVYASVIDEPQLGNHVYFLYKEFKIL